MPRLATSYVLAAILIWVAPGCLPSVGIETPDPAQIETSLFLIGDAGEPDPRDIGAPLESLTVLASTAPARSVIVYLGDNVYPDGITEEGRAEWADSRRRLAAQVLAVPVGAKGYFVPGNHDWASEDAFGLYALRLQEQMIAEMARTAGRDVRLLPANGCPGPATVIAGRLKLIAMDTQWWLHPYIVRDSASRCPSSTMAQVTAALRREAAAEEGQIVVVAGHHPLMTGGEHGGYCGLAGPFKRLGGDAQDVMSGSNKRMRDSLESAMRPSHPLVYAGAHDHNLQVLRGGTAVEYSLVSGAGSQAKVTCAVRLRESHYTSQHRSGFMRLDIMRDRGVLLRVYRYNQAGEGGVSYSRWLEPAS